MAYNNGLLNFGDSIVEVGFDNEDYSVDKAQIVEKDGTVHELGGGGGGDFSTAILTVTNSGETMSEVNWNGVFLKETPNLLGNYIDTIGDGIEGGNTATETMLLYNGEVYIYIDAEEIVSFTGNLTDMGDGKFKVTGDCSVTAKGFGLG